jgi:hypothetical protein
MRTPAPGLARPASAAPPETLAMVAVVFVVVLAFDQWLVVVGQVEQGLEEHQAE